MATLPLRPSTPPYDPIDIDQDTGASAYESYDDAQSEYSEIAGVKD